MAEAFEVPPWQVEEQDEMATLRVMEAMAAKRAVDAFNDKSATVPDGLSNMLARMLDALDAYDESRGIEPEE